MSNYKPPYTITSTILAQVSEISELISDIKHIEAKQITPKLRKKNLVRSITGSLQIEGNSFSEEKVTAVLDGKRVLGTLKEVEEVKGAIKAYESLENYDYTKLSDLLQSHKLMMDTLLNNAGNFRSGNVGVYGKDGVSHVAPPPYRVAELMGELFDWLAATNEHPLVVSSVFHYEFEFIHPFSDGNGRIGRLWQSVILIAYKDLFSYIPIESIVKENQQEYYAALEAAGSSGESTPFVEFMLGSILQSLKQFIKQNAESNQKSSLKSDQKILTQMKKNSKITIREICDSTGLSESGVKKIIKKLKDEGTLVRVGALKGGHWEVS
ncbi:MAG TPA: Fic family protein [Epsilonproteobacteria bacterium]|nr:Fic family protein [Campylobacterota bacterium]